MSMIKLRYAYRMTLPETAFGQPLFAFHLNIKKAASV